MPLCPIYCDTFSSEYCNQNFQYLPLLVLGAAEDRYHFHNFLKCVQSFLSSIPQNTCHLTYYGRWCYKRYISTGLKVAIHTHNNIPLGTALPYVFLLIHIAILLNDLPPEWVQSKFIHFGVSHLLWYNMQCILYLYIHCSKQL